MSDGREAVTTHLRGGALNGVHRPEKPVDVFRVRVRLQRQQRLGDRLQMLFHLRNKNSSTSAGTLSSGAAPKATERRPGQLNILCQVELISWRFVRLRIVLRCSANTASGSSGGAPRAAATGSTASPDSLAGARRALHAIPAFGLRTYRRLRRAPAGCSAGGGSGTLAVSTGGGWRDAQPAVAVASSRPVLGLFRGRLESKGIALLESLDVLTRLDPVGADHEQVGFENRNRLVDELRPAGPGSGLSSNSWRTERCARVCRRPR